MRWFNPEEFRCNCGCGLGFADMQKPLLERLDDARTLAGVPFNLTSTIRCFDWNKKIGGVPESAHCFGFAADIACSDSKSRDAILHGLYRAGFRRIGIYKTFIHVDCDPLKSNACWVGK